MRRMPSLRANTTAIDRRSARLGLKQSGRDAAPSPLEPRPADA
jgi:hypothetical protein